MIKETFFSIGMEKEANSKNVNTVRILLVLIKCIIECIIEVLNIMNNQIIKRKFLFIYPVFFQHL
jgi:hypothetical protein